MYLLDTNILSALVRDPQAQPIVSHIARVGDDNISTSVIVAAELRFVAAKKGSESLAERVDRILAAMPIIDFVENMTLAYAKIRAELEAKGQVIGGNDLLIAAQALTLDAVLVTDNEREFRRVEGLPVENWLSLPLM
jgi:tRNA(fMet)-specific endonuclease VapC